MSDTAQCRADAQITTNIIRSCEVGDDQSFSFCGVSKNMDTARLVDGTTQGHTEAYTSMPGQPRCELKESPTSQALLRDQSRSNSFQQNPTKIFGRCKHSKSFGRDRDVGAFRASLLSSPDLYQLCPADDLFYKGHLLPVYSHYQMQIFGDMVSLPKFQAESGLQGIPTRSSHAFNQLSSGFRSECPQRFAVPLHRGSPPDGIPQPEPLIIQRLQQPALVHPDPLGTLADDDAAGEIHSHRLPNFQYKRSSLKRDPVSERHSPTNDSKREVDYNLSSRSGFASPDADCYRQANSSRKAKKSLRSSKAIALAYWHKSIRILFKPLDRLHSKDNEQRWDHESMSLPRTIWFSYCKGTGTTTANSVHNMGFDRSGPMQKQWRGQSTPAAGIKYGLEANGATWQSSMYQRAELHIGIEGAIAHCKQSQQAVK